MGILVSVNCNAQRAIGWKAKGSLNAEHDPEYVEVIGMESNRCAKVGCFVALRGVSVTLFVHGCLYNVRKHHYFVKLQSPM